MERSGVNPSRSRTLTSAPFDTSNITTSVVPTGSFAAIKLDVETANVKFGILQILEGGESSDLIGGVCSLSFQARRTGTSIGNLRAGVIAWDSTG